MLFDVHTVWPLHSPQIAKIMDKFESQFETLDVRSAYMDAAMDRYGCMGVCSYSPLR